MAIVRHNSNLTSVAVLTEQRPVLAVDIWLEVIDYSAIA